MIERLERRLCLSSAIVGVATGTVRYQYPLADGAVAQVPLAGRWVYDDVSDAGAYVLGDPIVVTDLSGDYSLPLVGTAQTVRLLPRAGWGSAAGSSDAATASPGGVVPSFDQVMVDPVVVDVTAAYTASAAQVYGASAGGTGGTVASLFAFANQVMGNSDTNVEVNLVDTLETNYGESGSFTQDINTLASGGVTDVAAARKADQSDLTVLFEGDINRNSNGEVGLAFELSRNHPDAGHGDAIVSLLGNLTADGDTLAHELGHTMGADHDPPHAGSVGTYPFARGYPFVGADGTAYRDVMSYGTSTILPYYSTPTAFYDGHVLGTNSRGDNARAIRMSAPIVARYKLAGDEGPAAASAPATVLQSLKIVGTGTAIGGLVGKVRLTLSDAGPGTVISAAPISFYLAADGSSSGDVAIVSRTLNVALRAGVTRWITLQFTWPADLAAGGYQLEETMAVGGGFALNSLGTGPVTSAELSYEPPTVDLSVLPLTTAVRNVRPGRVLIVRFLLINQGNFTARGTIASASVLTASDGVSQSLPVTNSPQGISVRALTARAMPIFFMIPADLAPGVYTLDITIVPTTSVLDTGPGDLFLQVSLSVV